MLLFRIYHKEAFAFISISFWISHAFRLFGVFISHTSWSFFAIFNSTVAPLRTFLPNCNISIWMCLSISYHFFIFFCSSFFSSRLALPCRCFCFLLPKFCECGLSFFLAKLKNPQHFFLVLFANFGYNQQIKQINSRRKRSAKLGPTMLNNLS